MPRFLIGDDQGQIKSLEYRTEPLSDGTRYRLSVLSRRNDQERKASIQKIVLSSESRIGDSEAVVAGYSDGNLKLFTFDEEKRQNLKTVCEWKDGLLKQGSAYIGLAACQNKIYSCSTSGALQITTIPTFVDETTPKCQRTLLPMCLRDWKLSPDGITFAYGGDEVELSVWNTEVAFQCQAQDTNNPVAASGKRNRSKELFPGEIWRAKNVANDSLGLRQPIQITSIDHLSTSHPTHQMIIAIGTQLGNVRRYDTRVARRPVSDWPGISKVGGIQVVKKGLSEHELFVSDFGTNLFSVDLRNGRVVYGYKGLSGTVTSIAPSPSVVGSVANDRFARLHSSFPPPIKEGQNLSHKGAVLEKIYVTSIPTVVVWDDTFDETKKMETPFNEQEDEVWNVLEQVRECDAGSEEDR